MAAHFAVDQLLLPDGQDEEDERETGATVVCVGVTMRASPVRGHGWDKIAMGADPIDWAFIPDPALFEPIPKLIWTHDQMGKICI